MANVSFKAPTEYETEAADIERRRAYARALQEQGMQPLDTQMAGGWAIPRSPLEHVSRLAQQLAGAHGQKKAGEEQRALSGRMEGERSTDMAALVNALRGTPGQAAVTDPSQTAQSLDSFDPKPAVAAQPGDPNAAAAAALGSKFGDIRQMAPGLMQMGETRANRVEDRAFREQQANAQRDFQLQQLRQRAEDARLSQQERLAAQQQLQQMMIQAKEDNIRLAASMRPAPQPQAPVAVQDPNDPSKSIFVSPGEAIGKQPAQKTGAKGKTDVQATMDVYKAASEGLIGGLEGSVTGPLAGRIPAVTTAQQTAEGGVAAMAPVLKSIFRVAGEGTFTDKDQELLMQMVPKRTDSTTAAQKKIDNIDNIVSAKLGIPPPERPWRGATKAIGGADRRAAPRDGAKRVVVDY